jgi:hypothetical protein
VEIGKREARRGKLQLQQREGTANGPSPHPGSHSSTRVEELDAGAGGGRHGHPRQSRRRAQDGAHLPETSRGEREGTGVTVGCERGGRREGAGRQGGVKVLADREA